jgi:hypothetical protein
LPITVGPRALHSRRLFMATTSPSIWAPWLSALHRLQLRVTPVPHLEVCANELIGPTIACGVTGFAPFICVRRQVFLIFLPWSNLIFHPGECLARHNKSSMRALVQQTYRRNRNSIFQMQIAAMASGLGENTLSPKTTALAYRSSDVNCDGCVSLTRYGTREIIESTRKSVVSSGLTGESVSTL